MPGSLELAFLGDTLYDLYVRSRLVPENARMKRMQRTAAALVNAAAQSRALDRIEPLLTETERDVVRRARNAHQNPPKHAAPKDYHRATGFEALLGQLYLTGQIARLDELMLAALSETEIFSKADE